MSAGDLWNLPGDRQGIEVDGSTRTTLRVSVIEPRWPFPSKPREIPRDLCTRAPMRYYGGQTAVEAWEALL